MTISSRGWMMYYVPHITSKGWINIYVHGSACVIYIVYVILSYLACHFSYDYDMHDTIKS